MLQGTFDTLSLTEVLGLLAQSHKTGALWLDAGSVQGTVYLAEGRCCAAESGELTQPVTTDRELSARLVDVCFALARQHDGSFRFVADAEPSWRVAAGIAVDDAVGALERLLEEWREIQAVIPSLEVRPQLASELGTESIIVDQPRWRLLVCLDGRRSVRDVVHHTQRSVLDVCNALKELVEEGAVEIAPATPATIPAPPLVTAPEPEPDPAAIVMPDPFAGVEEEPAPATDIESHRDEAETNDTETTDDIDDIDDNDIDDNATHAVEREEAAREFAHVAGGAEPVPVFEDASDDGDARDRGALLRLFSALRDQ